MPVLSKTSYSYLSNAYENSSLISVYAYTEGFLLLLLGLHGIWYLYYYNHHL
jgi:hypothetical protein